MKPNAANESKMVRLGVIGMGGMGGLHAQNVLAGKVPGCELSAVADVDPRALAAFADPIGKFADGKKLISSGKVDALLIATPHYSHTTLGIAALQKGLHVLVEKPIGVHKADCEKLLAAHQDKKQVFAAMFNQRTDPHFSKVKELIDQGELGELVRVNWIITNWFRTQYYFDKGGWRATWAGEGGGALLNQCPHQLDLLQWLCGMPVLVRGFCGLGRRHHIEVEDEVTAYLEYANGATGVFITSTGEAPGTNRLEIAGDQGKVIVEAGKVTFTRNRKSAAEFSRTVQESFAAPEIEEIEIPIAGSGGQHLEVLQNFIAAIRTGAPLIAPAAEGIRSIELANAMLFSSFRNKPVTLPLDAKAYARHLKQLIRESTFVKQVAKPTGRDDLGKSFNTQ